MGSGSSKDKEVPEVARNRRLREFEEEQEIGQDTRPFPLRGEGQGMGYGGRRDSFIAEGRTGSALSTISVESSKNVSNTSKDPEVEEAIAELEETFKSFDRKVGDISTTTNFKSNSIPSVELPQQYYGRSRSCGPLGLEDVGCGDEDEYQGGRESGRSNYSSSNRSVPMVGGRKGTPGLNLHNNTLHIHQNGGGGGRGLRQRGGLARDELLTGHGGSQQGSLYSRRLHPTGLSHLTRGQLPGTEGANSAPPGVSTGSSCRELSSQPQILDGHEGWSYQPPKIQGFDIEKFREVNRQPKQSFVPISLHLPSSPVDNQLDGPEADPPSYTKDEMELLAKLESEASCAPFTIKQFM